MERVRSPPRLVTADQLRVAASSDCVIPHEMGMRLSSHSPVLELFEAHDVGRVRVRLRGELDLATAPLVAGRLRDLAARGEPVLLDLDGLAFMDASGIRLVLTAARAAEHDGWAFAVTPGSDAVRRLFEVVGLDTELPIERSAA
jgi:anti-sigma B factor antagonist